MKATWFWLTRRVHFFLLSSQDKGLANVWRLLEISHFDRLSDLRTYPSHTGLRRVSLAYFFFNAIKHWISVNEQSKMFDCITRGIKQGGFLEWRFELEDAFQTEFLCSNLQNSSKFLHLIKIESKDWSHVDGVDSLPSKTKNSRKFFIWTRFL